MRLCAKYLRISQQQHKQLFFAMKVQKHNYACASANGYIILCSLLHSWWQEWKLVIAEG